MAFFGMDSSYREGLPEKLQRRGTEWIVCGKNEDSHAHSLFRQIRPEDVVFIKQFSAQTGLEVLAEGVVLPGHSVEDQAGNYLPVKWAWKGRRHTVDPDDSYPFRVDSIYEEFDLAVQREIIDLMP